VNTCPTDSQASQPNPTRVHLARLDLLDYPPLWQFTLCEEERARAEGFRLARDKETFLRRRYFLRKALSDYVGAPAAEIGFERGAAGKPFLPDWKVDFSASESCGICSIAISGLLRVGIDIEELRLVPCSELIARQYFSPAENCELSKVPASRRIEAFFHVWTQKEAFIKALGIGLSYPLASFDVAVDPDQSPALLRLGRGVNGSWRLSRLPAPEGFRAVLCEGG
jgi:4'-phosphopantetheinyl transferase